MHPRTAVRREIAALITANVAGVRVIRSSVRDEAVTSVGADIVSVQIPNEDLEKTRSGEGVEPGVYRRLMNVEISVFAPRTGDGEAALEAAEGIARRIEILMNEHSGALDLVAETSGVIQAKTTVGVCTMSYLVELEELDAMKTE